jgi:tetratricopeptide (TPR) repeat protein
LEYLLALDHDFPARQVRHKRDMERERLLRALGHTYSELGKKRLALETYQRLAEFDPRNFENRYLLAQACLRFGEPELADAHFLELLKIHPTHMPSVRARLKMYFDKADFAAVVRVYETYLNAFLMQEVIVGLGKSSVRVNVPVDGRFHDIEMRIAHLPQATGELAIEVGKFALEIKRVSLEEPVYIGHAGVRQVGLWPGETKLRVQEMAPIKSGSYRALGAGATLRLEVPAQPRGIAAVRLTLRLFKPLDPDLWTMVEKSYKNLLRYDDLEAARGRSTDGISKGTDL